VADGKKKKTRRGGGPKAVKVKEGVVGGKVTITRTNRGKRKYVTVVTGLDTYGEQACRL
jgi:translation initiation factor 1 (eIF-1/SUI1)